MIPRRSRRSAPVTGARRSLGGLGVALAVAVFLSPFAYDQPDGLEFVGEKLGFLRRGCSAFSLPRADP